MRIWIAVLLAIVCCDDAALSQPIKHDVEVKPLIRNGTVVGCGIEYVAAFRDHTYRQGAVSGVSGSVTLMRPGNGREPTMMFKLLAVDFLGNDQGATQQFKVEHAKVFVENSVLANGVPMACENPLGGCSAVSLR